MKVKEEKVTDLNKIKEIAKTMLYLDIISDEDIPFIVHHPFTQSNVVVVYQDSKGQPDMVDLLDDERGLDRWRKSVAARIDKCNELWEILVMISKPYFFAFINLTHKYCSKKDLGQMLQHCWVSVEFTSFDKNLKLSEVLKLMKSVNPGQLMTPEDYLTFLELPDKFFVYRGVTPMNESKVNKAISWTLDVNTAEWFARRFDNKGKIYMKEVSRLDVVAYFGTRGESEVIVNPMDYDVMQIYRDLALEESLNNM